MISDKRFLVISVLVTIACYLTLLLPLPIMEIFVMEDGILESLTAVGFLITSICFVIAYFRTKQEEFRASNPLLKRLSYLALALIFFMGAGEEISWGQRILGVETPEAWREVNVQEETNLHNLEIFHNSSFEYFNSDRLFAIFWGTLMVGIPGLALLSPKIKGWLQQLVPIFPWSLGLLFVFNYLLAKVAKEYFLATGTFQGSRGLSQSVVEAKEGVYGFLFMVVGLYLINVMLRATRLKLQAKPTTSSVAD